MRITTLIIFIIVFMVGFTVGQFFKEPLKQEVNMRDTACQRYKLDAVYYKTNFEKCIDNNIAESYKNVK